MVYSILTYPNYGKTYATGHTAQMTIHTSACARQTLHRTPREPWLEIIHHQGGLLRPLYK